MPKAVILTSPKTHFKPVSRSPQWKLHAADLESEMLKRGMTFDPIDWSEPTER
jgi:hypothetical protein